MNDDKKKTRPNEFEEEREESVSDQEHLFDDWDDIVDDPEEASRFSKTMEGLMPEALKRSFTSGIGSLLMSDDGIRSLVADKKLPKEAVGYLVNQADATKKEFFRIVSREIRLFLEGMDFGGELTKILTSISFEVRTEIRFIPNDAAVKPNVRNRVTVKKSRSEDEPEESEVADEAEAGEPDATPEAPRQGRRWPLSGKAKRDPAPPRDSPDESA